MIEYFQQAFFILSFLVMLPFLLKLRDILYGIKKPSDLTQNPLLIFFAVLGFIGILYILKINGF
ncbi:hypothetical protein H0R92_10935 [Treponema sp. OMZ 840]|uniref:hypothetical protein n=1 Tax=Treponema sp. OMZ 840 TaxID=244313 RepID=UPI003D920969